ncbi:hypothetical protein BVX98_05175 [bacterium F11]|nr:hypothetical protein BVX98_05175 [bacterium F11]
MTDSLPLEHHLKHQSKHSQDFFWHRIRWHVVGWYIPKKMSSRLLDIGAGAGFLGGYLKRKFPTCTYCYSEPITHIEKALEKTYGKESNYRNKLSYRDIEVVTLLDVLEHQENDHDFLTEILHKMAPNSKLIIMVPAFQFLWSEWDKNLGHFRRYRKKTLRTLLEGADGQWRHSFYLFPEMVPLAIYRKWKHKLFPSSQNTQNNVEFPRLPPLMNHLLFLTSRLFLLFRSFSPIGTTLVGVFQKNPRI